MSLEQEIQNNNEMNILSSATEYDFNVDPQQTLLSLFRKFWVKSI